MKDYEIIYQGGNVSFEKRVRRKLRQGWKLHGTPFVQDGLICQAIVHKDVRNFLVGWKIRDGDLVSTCAHYKIVGEGKDMELMIDGSAVFTGSLSECREEAENWEAEK